MSPWSRMQCASRMYRGPGRITRLCASLVALALFGAIGWAAEAQPAPVEDVPARNDAAVVVEVSVMPPMVEESGDGLEGFDIDIWDAVSRDLGYDSTYRLVRFDSLLPDIAQGLADVGIAGITITAEREETVDFSHQYFESGLRILVPAERAPSVLAAARSLFAPERIRWLLGLLALTVVCGHVLWWADRKAPESPIERTYKPGIFQAFWCVVATVTTVGYGDVVPRNWPGRVAALLVMVVGVGFFGIAITQLSAEFAVQRLTSDIRHPRDLRGKAVVTVAGTTSIGVLRGLGADVVTVGAVEGMYPALDEGLAAAAVFDSPTLLRYARNEGAGRYEVVGGVFDAQDYGIAVPSDSPLREPINRALLRLKESGSYDLIYEKWFGSQG